MKCDILWGGFKHHSNQDSTILHEPFSLSEFGAEIFQATSLSHFYHRKSYTCWAFSCCCKECTPT